jgi:hypothetical protein
LKFKCNCKSFLFNFVLILLLSSCASSSFLHRKYEPGVYVEQTGSAPLREAFIPPLRKQVTEQIVRRNEVQMNGQVSELRICARGSKPSSNELHALNFKIGPLEKDFNSKHKFPSCVSFLQQLPRLFPAISKRDLKAADEDTREKLARASKVFGILGPIVLLLIFVLFVGTFAFYWEFFGFGMLLTLIIIDVLLGFSSFILGMISLEIDKKQTNAFLDKKPETQSPDNHRNTHLKELSKWFGAAALVLLSLFITMFLINTYVFFESNPVLLTAVAALGILSTLTSLVLRMCVK